jgi:hypothetical protein
MFDFTGLENNWHDDSPDHPDCDLCGLPIGSPEEDEKDDGTEPEVAYRIYRDHPDKPGVKQEIRFHIRCAQTRMIGGDA